MSKTLTTKTRISLAISCYEHLIRMDRIRPGGAANMRLHKLRNQVSNWKNPYPLQYKLQSNMFRGKTV